MCLCLKDITALPGPNGRSLRPSANMEKYARLGRQLPWTAHLITFVIPSSSRSLRAPVVVDSSAPLDQPIPGQSGPKMAPPAKKICMGGLASEAITALAVSRKLSLRYGCLLPLNRIRSISAAQAQAIVWLNQHQTSGECLISAGSFSADSPLIAGTGFAGSGGDGLPGPETLLMLPANAIMDADTGDVYVADYSNYAVKVVHGETGMWDLRGQILGGLRF